jgi:hypothetical protein
VLPLPSIRSIIDEARVLANEHGRDVVGARDIKQALESRQRSDLAIRAAFRSKPKSSQQRSSHRQANMDELASHEPPTAPEQMSKFFAQRSRRRIADPTALNARHPLIHSGEIPLFL